MKRIPRLEVLTSEEIEKMARWFVSTVGALDEWQDFAQEAHLILFQRREAIWQVPEAVRKVYAAKVVWNHWKVDRPTVVFYRDELEGGHSRSYPELFYEFAIEHLTEMLSERAKIVLRELLWPSEVLRKLLRQAELRKKRLGDKPVVPLFSKIAETVGFRVSEFIGEIREKSRAAVRETVAVGLL